MREWEYKIYEPAPGAFVYVSPGHFAMNNPGLVTGSRYTLAVDSMSAVAATVNFYETCKEQNDIKPVKFFVFTHSHGDHILAAHIYQDAAKIGTYTLSDTLKTRKIPGQKYSPLDLTGARITLPDICFSGELELDLGGRKAIVREMGHCHSESDTIVYLPDCNTVYCGDLLFNYELPDGSLCRVSEWLNALDQILSLNADVFIPGHGPVADRNEVLQSRRLLQLLFDTTKEGYDAGKTARQIVQELDLKDYEEYAEPARRVTLVDSIYRELQGKIGGMPEWNVNEEMDRIRHQRGDWEEHFVVPWKAPED